MERTYHRIAETLGRIPLVRLHRLEIHPGARIGRPGGEPFEIMNESAEDSFANTADFHGGEGISKTKVQEVRSCRAPVNRS